MIIQIRGTSGSGKSTIAKMLMAGIPGWKPLHRPNRKKPIAYFRERGDGIGSILTLGHYESPCGGCDNVGSAKAVYETITEYHSQLKPDFILCEGLLLSEDVKWTSLLKDEGFDLVIYFLITPLEECIDRVKKRRKAAGNEKPFNEKNTANRVATIERARLRLIEKDVNCWRLSSSQVFEVITKGIRNR